MHVYHVGYKQIIEYILCTSDEWLDKFSILININEYFFDHFKWELKLSKALKKTLIELDKEYEYEFEYDNLIISFSDNEIDVMLSRYDDNIKDIMCHFTNLLSAYIYTREYLEKFDNYSSVLDSTGIMRYIEKSKISKEEIDNSFIKNVLRKVKRY